MPMSREGDGITTYTLSSDYQRGPNALVVATPRDMDAAKQYPVVYTLPVGAGPLEERHDWGWSVAEVTGAGFSQAPHGNLADQYGAIFVFPVFDTLPWYGDNPQDTQIRQESYLLHAVIPFIEQHYPVIAAPRGRLLLGFSKSGFGAISLLLRQLDLFGRAAAWDAPLMMETPERWGASAVFPTPESFAPYYIPSLLAQHQAELTSPNGSSSWATMAFAGRCSRRMI